MTPGAPATTPWPLILYPALAALIGAVCYQFANVLHDTALGLGFRFQLDYGEGIVWQQALLMFGPKMYSPSPALPFIVFHYPPLYHIVVRALMMLGWDPLFAGRLVSVVASAASAVAVGTLIMLGARGARSAPQLALAVAIAILLLCFDAVRFWGILMRVDMLAIALGLAGTVVFVRGRGSTAGTTAALLLCVASVFTKQTQLPAGISVFAVALVCHRRAAILGGLVAGSIGLACAVALEITTGGFFKNIISDNVNPFTLHNALTNIRSETKTAPFVLVMLVSFARIAYRLIRGGGWAELGHRRRPAITEAVVGIHFILACFSALEIVKDGASTNYFLDMLASGCVVIGLALQGMTAKPMLLAATILILAVATADLRPHFFTSDALARISAQSEPWVRRIAASDRAVTSDNMVLVMRAGKSLVFEPAIVRVLVAEGKWDPAPLLAMIRDHGFAFALTFDGLTESGPVVTQALLAAYPREAEATDNLTVHYPPSD